MKELRLVIGVPSGGEWNAHFGNSLVHLACHLSRQVLDYQKQQFALVNRRGSILPKLRHDILQYALQEQATHLLFIDSDQTFPADLVARLLKHEKRVIGANIATKMLPPSPTARQWDPQKPAGRLVYSTPTSPKVEKVWRLGMGIMLIDLAIFKLSALKEGPWFDTTFSPETNDYRGEDWFFCERLQKANVGIWVEHRVSYEVGHVGEMTYTHQLVNEAQSWQEAS